MKRGLRSVWPLLLLLLLSGCGRDDAVAPVVAESPPAPIDPATLESELSVEPDPVAEEEPDIDWQPPSEGVPKARWREVLRAADAALAEGRVFPDSEEPGALARYLGILITDPTHVQANAGLDRVLAALLAEVEVALPQGDVGKARLVETVLVSVRPEHQALVGLRTRIDVVRKASDSVRRGQTHAHAGRVMSPAGRNAVASYREALGHFPDFLPALDGLARLEQGQLGRAWSAAQAGDYAGADQRLELARQIRPESGGAQDMAARIVELRQARTSALLAQGMAAVDALDLELASRRLSEAQRESLQAQGLDALAERIELARHYGRHAPRQVFSDTLAVGGAGPELVVIPHGVFRMGSPADEPQRQDNEGPVREVTFARGFALARHETTVAEFRRFVEATGYRSVASRRGRSVVYDEKGGAMVEHAGVDWQRDHAGRPAEPQQPVIHVAFEDVEAYVAWLSAQTGQRYRLPSEAEFEHALRAGSDQAFPWGSAAPTQVLGNVTGDGDRSRSGRRWSNAIRGYSDGYWGVAPVRSFPEEGFGTYDLIGNVSEWVEDCWHDSYRRAPSDGSAWVNAGCEERVIRGASWASALDRVRSAYRQPSATGVTHARLGFRVVREL